MMRRVLPALGAGLVAAAAVAYHQAVVNRLERDATYGCLTRAGVDRRWARTRKAGRAVVFGDIDAMHELNARLGYEEVNGRIRRALARLTTRPDDVIGGRWYSGDELVYIVPATDGDGFARRMQRAFEAEGLGITLAVAPLAGRTLVEGVEAAQKLVSQAKAEGRRGTIGGVEKEGCRG